MGGPIVAATLIGEVGDPTDFKATAAYEKAAGLNLVEDTSGRDGQHTEEEDTPPMRISKRGSSRARKQLYLTTQQWIQWCPYAKAWYQHKIGQHAGCDGARKLSLVALMRKLTGALYHVGRGADCEPEKLFGVERLETGGGAGATWARIDMGDTSSTLGAPARNGGHLGCALAALPGCVLRVPESIAGRAIA